MATSDSAVLHKRRTARSHPVEAASHRDLAVTYLTAGYI